jgi:hypothetical protein
MNKRSVSTGNALTSMVVYEFGYGGHVKELSENHIVVETRILGCVDQTIFEGQAEEMRMLVIAAAHHSMVLGEKGVTEALAKRAIENLESTPGNIGGRPFFLANLVPQLMGSPVAKIALLAAHGVDDKEDFRKLLACPLKDLAVASELAIETKEPLLFVCKNLCLVA